ncbi:MAG: hypothetical protein LBF69_05490 [Prevotellaceae bacterium]|jgi:hypothetical protein|nr:hypothetical protein [Prevotellaceae bacterium]
MQNINQPLILSVQELNKVLEKLQENKELALFGTFSEIDIVFVAGLFLWYMQHKENWTKIPRFFSITENDNAWNHSHYFQQIYELYNVRHSDIFENFPNAYNTTANSFSRYFAPPIYITNKSIGYFFGTQSNKRIDNLKKEYKNNFDISDFVDTRVKAYKTKEQKFKEYAVEIQRRLETVPPIFVFIFIVTCKRLARKENRTFEKTKDYIEKIWQFAQTYTNGLHELAQNIIEHSGRGENDGQGMITIRAYSGTSNDKEKIKVLETHVFDYGEKGIYETLRQNTTKNKTGEADDIYTQDLEILTNSENTYTISDFIEPVDNQKLLLQQFRREMAHYGLMNFKSLIERHEGIIIASSIRKENDNNREQYVFSKQNITNEEINECDITKGTSYYFEMPFIPALFEEKTKNKTESSNPQTVSSLSNLQNVKLVEYADIHTIQQIEGEKHLINFRISDFQKEIGNRANENSVCKGIIDKLNSLHKIVENSYIALNFDGVTLNKSNLLRILVRLSREMPSDFIVYNIRCEVFIGLIKDNEQWFEKMKDKWNYIDDHKIDTSYWLKGKSILFFTRYENPQQQNYFYFADFLFGDTPKIFNSINKIVSNTFPNTTCICNNKEKEFETDDEFSIPQKLQNKFFYSDSIYLLPFDTLLKSKEYENNVEKELFLFNIKTIIQNKLFGRGTYYGIVDYVDNFDGYHIPNTHFKIGNKVHSSDFYYAKRLFQNSFYTTRLAMYLAKQIDKKIKERNKRTKITLVGYEMYSELILSLTEKFLKDKGIYKDEDINHFVIQNENDKWIMRPKDTFSKYIKEYNQRDTIIIVPIAATGSTTHKIENEIKTCIYKYQKNENHKSQEEAEKLKDQYCFFEPRYNIILAQDRSEDSNGELIFKNEINEDKKQESIIILAPKWYKIKDCELCYDKSKSMPLFETDNSSLTPSLIFGNPEGLTKSKSKNEAKPENEVENLIAKFDDLCFDNSIEYQSISRNDNYRIYDVDSDRFIDANRDNIIEWLKYIKCYLESEIKDKLKPTDNVVIIAPCHESNSKFINLINEYVFSSAATIIHHQNGVDFVENFSLLNKNYLEGKNTKIFFVDDSLITGSHFFELFDLIRKVTNEGSPLTASIFINDQAVPFIHDRVVRWSKKFFAFATYNQPPTTSKRPLEHEQIRYESLQKNSLHDTLCEHFHKKANKLCPEQRSTQKEEPLKQIRRLKMFEATHKIYDYFAKDETVSVPNLIDENERSSFVYFNLKFDKKNIEIDEPDMDRKALLKVLSQYPFILYKDLREATFQWHKKLLEELPIPNENCFDIKEDYDDKFSTFKFRLRRAAFLDNYQILEKDFLEKLFMWFIKIDKYIEDNKSKFENNELTTEEENLRDFLIFVLGNYAEMIQKNGWVACHILKEIEKINFEKSENQSKQFLRMLKIEATTIIDDFMEMINKDYRFKWRDMYKELNSTELYHKTDKIVDFFDKRPDLLITNKFLAVKETFLVDLKEDIHFVNYLWIKQLLYADCIDKDPHLPKEIKYQDKIDEIIKKMKGFFPDKEKVQAFFIVTDGQQTPYVISQDNYIFNEFTDEFKTAKENDNLKTQIIIDFLKGKKCNTGNATETTAEFVYNKDEWRNVYTNDVVKFDFLPQNTEWLYMIRISKLKEDKDGKCNFETQGLLGFYSKDDLQENILSKQLLMLLRKDMSEFINKHHKSDEFSLWVQQNEKTKFYEEKFDKFNHTANRHIEITEKVRNEGKPMALFAINQLVFGQVLLGNKYAEYLNSKKVEGSKLSGSTPLTDEEKKQLRDFTLGLQEIYQTPMKYFEKFEINIKGYENIVTKIRFEELKIILIELICNTVAIKSGKNKKININFDNDKIIFSSITGRNKTPEEIDKINKDIKNDYPKDGIGFFVINKIVNSVFPEKNITVSYNDANKEFQVLIPIN